MGERLSLTGNDAAAEAMRQINPDVVAAYPITPQTELMHKFAEYVHDGVVDTELILVESEHSAMSACVGAAAAGARVMTATASQGLALMWEVLYVASGNRLPIVMTVINRAMSAPINIHCDHSDTMGARDSGWIQMYCEDSQEAYDSVIQGVRIAEDKNIMLPLMVNLDGFVLSHTSEVVDILDDQQVKDFIGLYEPKYSVLDVEKPVTFGPLDLQDYYFEHKRQQSEAVKYIPAKVIQVGKEYAKISGREYSLFELYSMEDAEIAVIVAGSAAGTTKAVIDQLRAKGIKAGLLRIRLFRPFPAEEIAKALKGVKAIAVLDRAETFSNQGGPIFLEVKAALYGGTTPVVNYIYGLGGRDINMEQIAWVYGDLQHVVKEGPAQMVQYLGVRE